MNLIPDVGEPGNSTTCRADCHWHPSMRTGACIILGILAVMVIGMPLDLVFGVTPAIGIPIAVGVGFLGPWLYFVYAPRRHPLYGMNSGQRHAIRAYDNFSTAAQAEVGPRSDFVKLVRIATDPKKVLSAAKVLAHHVDERERVLAKTLPPPGPSREELETEEFVNTLTDRAEAIKQITREIESGAIR